jgi:hypothetical protein
MKMNGRRFLVVLGGVILFSNLVVAQSAPQTALDFEFSVMAWERMRDVGYAQIKTEARSKPRPVAADFEILPLRISSQGRSDLYRYEGPAPVRLVATSGEGDALRATRMIGAITDQRIPRQAMLMLGPAADDALTVTVLDDSPAAFPGQHVRVVNLAEEPIQGTIDGQTFRVDTTRATLAPRRVGENARIGVAFERQGRPIVVFDQSLRVGAEERVMLVFLPPFREGADVRVRVVRDQVFEPAEP